MGAEAAAHEASLPTPQVGQVWRDWVNGGDITADCVVTAVGEKDLELGVLWVSSADWAKYNDCMPGSTIVRGKLFVRRYWRLVG